MAFRIPTIEEIAERFAIKPDPIFPSDFIGPLPPGAKVEPLPEIRREPAPTQAQVFPVDVVEPKPQFGPQFIGPLPIEAQRQLIQSPRPSEDFIGPTKPLVLGPLKPTAAQRRRQALFPSSGSGVNKPLFKDIFEALPRLVGSLAAEAQQKPIQFGRGEPILPITRQFQASEEQFGPTVGPLIVGAGLILDALDPLFGGGKSKVAKEFGEHLIRKFGKEQTERLVKKGGQRLIRELNEFVRLNPQAAKQRGFVESIKKSPNVRTDVRSGVQGVYVPVKNSVDLDKARQLVKTDPQGALFKLSQPERDADYTMTALALIEDAQNAKNFSRATDIANQTAKELTKGGQFIQAAAVLNKLTPESILLFAAKRTEGKLSPDLSKKLLEQAKKIQDIPERLPYKKFLETQKLLETINKNLPSFGDLKKSVKEKGLKKTLIELGQTIKKTPGGVQKIVSDWVSELANLPRAIMSSGFDFSFGLRQGIVAGPRFPKEFGKAFKSQFKPFASEKGYNDLMNSVFSHPDFELANQAKVAFSDINLKLSGREERYMSSWAEKIPIIKIPVRATNRAYTAMANKLRMDTFSTLVKNAETAGLNPRKDPKLLESIAGLINDITGRGDLPAALEKAAPLLNAFFFSPRLAASRINLLNPLGLGKGYLFQPPAVRKEYLKTMLAFGTTMTTILGLASLVPGVEVQVDPRSADFAKIKIGNTRIDVMGGFQQYLRIAAQVISGKYISTTTGKVITVGEGYKPLTRLDIIQRGFESKESPIFSFVTTLLKGQDFQGEDVSVPKEIKDRFVPMVVADLWEISQDDPSLLPLGFIGVFGVGLQTYPQTDALVKLNEIENTVDPRQTFADLKKENPKLAEQVKTAKIQEDFTEFDWDLVYMGVANGQRAEFLLEHFNKLPQEEKASLYDDLRKKRLISDRVADQIKFLLDNPNFEIPNN